MKKKITYLLLIWSLTSILLTGCGSSIDATSSIATGGSSAVSNKSSIKADIGSAEGFNDSYEYSSSNKVNSLDAGSNYEYSNDYDTSEEGEVSTENIENTENTENDNTVNKDNEDTLVSQEKLIYKYSAEIETMNFDESYNKLLSLMDEFKCIIESEVYDDNNISYFEYDYYSNDKFRKGITDTLTIRVPSRDYKQFITKAGTIGNITSKNQVVDNITQRYNDTTAELESLEAQMIRLKEMLNEATYIEDMITINDSIASLQTEINSLKTDIRGMDADIAYSYVTLTLTEVLEYSVAEEPVKTNTFVDRLKNTVSDTWKNFLDFLENFLFTLIRLLPTIVILGTLFIIFRLIFNKKIKAWKETRKSSKYELNALLNYKEVGSSNEVIKDESGSNIESNSEKQQETEDKN